MIETEFFWLETCLFCITRLGVLNFVRAISSFYAMQEHPPIIEKIFIHPLLLLLSISRSSLFLCFSFECRENLGEISWGFLLGFGNASAQLTQVVFFSVQGGTLKDTWHTQGQARSRPFVCPPLGCACVLWGWLIQRYYGGNIEQNCCQTTPWTLDSELWTAAPAI